MEKSKLNQNSIIKCDNKNRFIFFNCDYKGKPTEIIPKWQKLQLTLNIPPQNRFERFKI